MSVHICNIYRIGKHANVIGFLGIDERERRAKEGSPKRQYIDIYIDGGCPRPDPNVDNKYLRIVCTSGSWHVLKNCLILIMRLLRLYGADKGAYLK